MTSSKIIFEIKSSFRILYSRKNFEGVKMFFEIDITE